MTDLLVPLLLLFVSLYALWKKQDVYAALLQGAKSGLHTVLSIAPALIVLLTAVNLLRAGGFLDLLSKFLTPLCEKLLVPPEVVPLMLVRPISASAALALGADILAACGVNSVAGRTAAVLLGCSETTFYAISVYFGAAGVKDTRYALPAALVADLAGYAMAVLSVRLFFR